MRYIYKWKCIVSNSEVKQYFLTRWNKEQSATIYNMVPMGRDAYDKHIKG